MEQMFTKPLSQLTYDVILGFLSTNTSENVRLDYKREITGSEGEKKELAKDVSAMANSQGGHIIIGVDEQNQSPISPPFGTSPIINNQNASEWIAQILNANIAPRVNFDLTKPIPFPSQSDKSLIVIRIPPSNHAPHMVTYQGDNRFYRRYFRRLKYEALPAEEYEVRDMFERSRRMSDYVDEYLRREGYADTQLYSFGRHVWSEKLGWVTVRNTDSGPEYKESSSVQKVLMVSCPTHLEDFIELTASEMQTWLESEERIYKPVAIKSLPSLRLLQKNRIVSLQGVVYTPLIYPGLDRWPHYVRIHRNGFVELGNMELTKGEQLQWVGTTGLFWMFLGFIQDFYSHVDLNSSFRIFLHVASHANALTMTDFAEGYTKADFTDNHTCLERNITYGEEFRLSDLSNEENIEAIVFRYASRLGNAFRFPEPYCYNKVDGKFPLDRFGTNLHYLLGGI